MTEDTKVEEVFWAGEVEICQLCKEPLGVAFVDGRTSERYGGVWAEMCIRCHRLWGVGLGIGKGQLYAKEDDGRWKLLVGGV